MFSAAGEPLRAAYVAHSTVSLATSRLWYERLISCH
jgi:hypothetical protein